MEGCGFSVKAEKPPFFLLRDSADEGSLQPEGQKDFADVCLPRDALKIPAVELFVFLRASDFGQPFVEPFQQPGVAFRQCP